MVWVLGQGQVTFLNEVLGSGKVSFSCDFSMVWVPGAGPSYISIPHILPTNV